MAEFTVEINNEDIYYREFGEGIPLILLHGGWGSGYAQWKDHLDYYKEHFKIIVPDFRGHGMSSNKSKTMTNEVLAKDVIGLIEMLDLEKPFISGWSMGGYIGLYIGIHYQSYIRGLIIGGVGLGTSEVDENKLRKQGLFSPGNIDYHKYVQSLKPDYFEMIKSLHPRYPDQFKDLVYMYSYRYYNPTLFLEDEIKNITVPLLLILGDRDQTPLNEIIQMYETIPNSELSIVPNADHSMCRTRAHEYANIVIEFLKRH